MNEQPAFVYYTAQAANRRHFQQLFFAVTGFTWSFALAVFAVLEPRVEAAFLVASGLILIGGAFIAQRLPRRERASFEAMLAAWREISLPREGTQPARSMPGAMAIACSAQAFAGCGLIVLTLVP